MLQSEGTVAYGPGEGCAGWGGLGAGALSSGLAWHAVGAQWGPGSSRPGLVPVLQEGAVIWARPLFS